MKAAIEPPRAALDSALDVLRLLQRLVGASNTMLRSDLAVAAVLAEAAARSAAWNVRINLPSVADPHAAQAIRESIERSLREARELCNAIESACL